MTDHRTPFGMTPTQVLGFAIFLLATGVILVILSLVRLTTGAVSATVGVGALLQGGGYSVLGAYLPRDARRRRRTDPLTPCATPRSRVRAVHHRARQV